MKLLREIMKEGEMFFTGLGVFVGLPFLAALIYGRGFNKLWLELIVTIFVYTILFIWVMRGGISRIQKNRRNEDRSRH
jgi:hypothetical protein